MGKFNELQKSLFPCFRFLINPRNHRPLRFHVFGLNQSKPTSDSSHHYTKELNELIGHPYLDNSSGHINTNGLPHPQDGWSQPIPWPPIFSFMWTYVSPPLFDTINRPTMSRCIRPFPISFILIGRPNNQSIFIKRIIDSSNLLMN